MSGILDFIKDQITPDTINRISTEIGEDPEKTRQAVDASVPLIAGALSTQEVAQATGDAVVQPSKLGGLGDMISGGGGLGGGLGGALGGVLGGASGAGGMLDSILGGSQSTVQKDISNASGIQPQKVMRILTMLAPVVLAAYTKYKNAPPADAPPKTTQGGGGILGDIIDRVT